VVTTNLFNGKKVWLVSFHHFQKVYYFWHLIMNRRGKNYLDRGYNTVTYHVVTSFLSLNFDTTDKIQEIEEPWLCQKLDSQQIQELFEVTPEMQKLIDQQLYDYLTTITILIEACAEKNSEVNSIDDQILRRDSTTSKQKSCIKYGMKEIENNKKICPQCSVVKNSQDSLRFNKKLKLFSQNLSQILLDH